MAEPFSHPLQKKQTQNLAVLVMQSQEAQNKAQAYFQGIVDGIPVPEGVNHTFRLSEDGSSILCIPTSDAPSSAE